MNKNIPPNASVFEQLFKRQQKAFDNTSLLESHERLAAMLNVVSEVLIALRISDSPVSEGVHYISSRSDYVITWQDGVLAHLGIGFSEETATQFADKFAEQWALEKLSARNLWIVILATIAVAVEKRCNLQHVATFKPLLFYASSLAINDRLIGELFYKSIAKSPSSASRIDLKRVIVRVQPQRILDVSPSLLAPGRILLLGSSDSLTVNKSVNKSLK